MNNSILTLTSNQKSNISGWNKRLEWTSDTIFYNSFLSKEASYILV